jgi:FMN-dependent NADH-azoreductase
MAKLLYITCDLRLNEQSCSLTAGLEFLNEYLKWNPGDEIHMLDLYRDQIQPADADVLSALEKIGRGHHLATLTTFEQRKISRIWRHSDQFVAADKYVLVSPMWKPGFPPEIWAYLDAVLVVNKTYSNTADGPQGLLKDQGRKCLLIHATEGFVYGEKEAYCVANVRSTLNFVGVEDFKNVVIEGFDPTLEENATLMKKEIRKVVEVALNF